MIKNSINATNTAKTTNTIAEFSYFSAGLFLLVAIFSAFAFNARAQDSQDPIAPNVAPMVLGSPTVSTSAVSDRLERLERDIQTLNQQLSRMPMGNNMGNNMGSNMGNKMGAAAPTPSSTTSIKDDDLPAGVLDRILVRLSRLEEEVRSATDGMERVDHRFGLIESRLDTIFGDVDFRLSRIEGSNGGVPQRLNAAPGPASVNSQGPASGQAITPITGYTANPSVRAGQKGVLGSMSKNKMDTFLGSGADGPKSTGDGTAPQNVTDQTGTDVAIAEPVAPRLMYLPEGSVDEQYKHSFNLLRRAKYVEAEAAWKEFISVHSDEKLVENARYWLGETYYVQKRFLDSAQAFLQSYQSAPTGNKAADSLLKLGKSMSNMDKKDEACAAYAKLRKEFSAISPNVSKTLNRETKALGCK